MGTQVRLFLGGHCVETAAKNEFKRLMDEIFEAVGDTSDLEARIELVRAFLDTADFPALRASDGRLAGTEPATVSVARGEGGGFLIEYE